jgi:hypothetical protein
MSNNFELLQLATLRLSQDGSIKDRLAEAYAEHLVSVDMDALPASLRPEFDALCAAMHREAPQIRESAIRASVRKMSVHEAREHAALVVRLFAAMVRQEAGGSVPQRIPRPAPVVQLFALEG